MPPSEMDKKRAQATARMLKRMREGEEKDNEKLNKFFNQKPQTETIVDQNLIEQAVDSYELVCQIIQQSQKLLETSINLDVCNLMDFFSAAHVPNAWLPLFGNAQFKEEIEAAVSVLRQKTEAIYLTPRPDLVLNPFKMIPGGPSVVKVIIITNSLASSNETSLGYAMGYKNFSENAELEKIAIAVADYRSKITGNEVSPSSFDKTFANWIMQGILMLNLAFLDVPTIGYNKKSPNKEIWLGVLEMLIDHIVNNGNKHLIILFTKSAMSIVKINLKNAHPVIFDIENTKTQEELNLNVGKSFVTVNAILSREGETSIVW